MFAFAICAAAATLSPICWPSRSSARSPASNRLTCGGRIWPAPGEEIAQSLRSRAGPQRKLLVVGVRSLRVAVALDPDAILGVPDQDVAELRKLFHGGGLQDRAVVAEEQRRPQVGQDAVFGAPRVGDLPELLLLLVQVIADGASGDASYDRADGGAFPSARDCANP